MKLRSGGLGLILLCTAAFTGSAFAADTAKDVPANHWARNDVAAVLQRDVMSAPAGKFDGNARVTRTDLIRAMAGFGKSLERNAWQPATGRRFKLPLKDNPPVISEGMNRYELAAIIARMGSYAAAGIPKPGTKRFGNSKAIPPATEVSAVKPSDPAYPAAQYLAKNRMVGEKSVLATPGSQLVTGKEVAEAIAAVITAVSDMNTDEPQNRPKLS